MTGLGLALFAEVGTLFGMGLAAFASDMGIA
jgi:hypothetical protein